MPAQQPGMTGQAKEDVLLRTTELGVVVADGKLAFNPALLQVEEFLAKSETFHYINGAGKKAELLLPEKSLAFTVCRIPVVYQLSSSIGLKIYDEKDEVLYRTETLKLDEAWSQKVFEGDAQIGKIEVSFPEGLIR